MQRRHRSGALLLALAGALVPVLLPATGAAAAPRRTPPPTAASSSAASSSAASSSAAPAPPARAYVVVDADTGVVLAGLNEHEPRYVASMGKIMTVLVALEKLPPGSTVTVSQLAASQPAMKVGMNPGEQWKLGDVLHAVLMSSANDGAYALAEAAGGTIQGFDDLMAQAAQRMGMRDSTWLDPAGFDGREGYGGGSRVSAFDLAIAARNALGVPEIMRIAATRRYVFTGPDGTAHELPNHNKFLDRYQGATGMKTGYTSNSGRGLVATATRGGRNLIAVVVDAPDPYGLAAQLLDQGFATAPSNRTTGEVLPRPSVVLAAPAPPSRAPSAPRVSSKAARASSAFVDLGSWVRRVTVAVLALGAVAFVLRRRAVRRRRARRLARVRALQDARRRGMIDIVDADRYYHGIVEPHRHVAPVEAWRADRVQRVARRPRPLVAAGRADRDVRAGTAHAEVSAALRRASANVASMGTTRSTPLSSSRRRSGAPPGTTSTKR